MDDPRPKKQFKIKDFSWLWYLKEAAWVLLIWILVSQAYGLMYHRINAAIGMFAILLVSVWARAIVTKDSALSKLRLGGLLRHAIIISIFAMVIAWFLAIVVIRMPGWGYFWGS